ncbi:MAG: AraC family transcriptional regulator [Bacteroides sp.]|nr:AraC family transcriptional regulator [Bacteroides sp.]
MTNREISSYTIDELSKQLDNYAIKNFIISDTDRKIPGFLLEYPHILDGIVFAICIKGWAKFKINIQEFVIKPNTITTILPNSIIEPIEKSDDFVLETLFFSFDFIAELPLPPNFNILGEIEQNPCLYVSEEQAGNLLKFHTFTVEQYNRREHLYRQEIAKCLLFALIAEIGALYSMVESNSNKLTRTEKLISQFLILLRKHYKEERNVSFYADKMCLTPKYLTGIIKKSTGKSIMTWIHEAVIAAAKVQLKSSNNTIVQISEELNFIDASIFCRFFRKHTGMTPKQYRESGVNVLIP